MKPTELTMRIWDGTELFYRAWLPAQQAHKALLLFHRGHEHSARWEEVVDALVLDDVAVFAWDARGHGRSPGERGSAESLAVVVKDVDSFVRQISEKYGIALADMIVLAHSVGAVTVAAWVHDYAPPIRAMILAVPAFRVKLYVPFAIPFLRLRKKGFVKSYVKAKMLTHDLEQAARYHADGFIFRQIAVNILLDLHDAGTRLLADAGAITVPTLILGAGRDWVVKLAAQQQFFERLSSPVKEMEVFPGFYHSIFHEKDRHLPIARARGFILERFRQTAPTGDSMCYTQAEYDRLRAPGAWQYALVKCIMKTVGRLSHGIRLGWRAGFDSGVMLDYVYENRPHGLFDRQYLNSIGWRGIRQRKVNLENVLRDLCRQVHAAGKPVRILDIAAGAGRYVLETMRDLPEIPLSAVLRDYKQENLDAARRLATELGVANVSIVPGDAFDRASLANITPKPTITIVSGLYELFPSNEPVMDSLRGLAEAVEPGGFLIYTNQPWHPQMEFIARVLRNREGRPWIMRRRTQAEMDDLVRTAGFEKVRQEIDQWGIFTVAMARKGGAT